MKVYHKIKMLSLTPPGRSQVCFKKMLIPSDYNWMPEDGRILRNCANFGIDDCFFTETGVTMPVTKKKSASKKKAAEKKSTATTSSSSTAVKKTAPTTKKTAAKSATAPTQASSALEGYSGIEPYVEKKGEEYMNENQIAHFRHILGAWKKELMEEVDRTLTYMQDEAANFPDPNDRATQESDFTMELRTRDRERKLIKKIDESVDTLDNGEYGYCESCGIEIGIRRLEARPTATLCIDCKTLDEIREKQRNT